MRKLTKSIASLVLSLFVLCAIALAQNAPASDKSDKREVISHGKSDTQRISREARHELVMLPYYSVFDNLGYQVNGNTLVLVGQVVRPTLKSDAEARVRDIEGVEKVENKIEVLPTSINDDRLRRNLYRAIYGHPALNKYAMGAVPPIHIIVKNGQVTLEGVVLNEMDKNIANIQANGVSGVFKVTNNLKVEQS